MVAPGTRLGTYEVVAPLGAGGMGEVYRARDAALGREVAIKVLPAPFSSDPERVARFRREAQALAALNHPHIATIHGVDEAAGSQFLVMELVDGETLDIRIARGPIPVEEALAIAAQIARALEAAHDKGIIHRDLKPANIALTADGSVKVLDFGLAKLASGEGRIDSPVSLSPTITSPALVTGAGVLLGTAAYMSPEQAKGREADKRSDVWAFGCVLFEMLTGERAYDGEDVTETIAAIVRGHPDWDRLPANTPAAVRLLLKRCLEKNRAQRVGDLSTASFIISELRHLPMAAPVPDRRRAWRAPALGIVALAAVALPAFFWPRSPAPVPLVSRSQFFLPDNLAFTGDSRSLLDVSRDGSRVVFVAGGRLHVRSLSNLHSTPVPGTEDGPGGESAVRQLTNTVLNPVFSPDGRSVAYYHNGFKRIAIEGGAPSTLAAGEPPWGMSWSGNAVVFGQGPNGIMRVADVGGTPELIAGVAKDELASNPSMLPDNRRVLFTLATNNNASRWERGRIVVHDIPSGTRTVLFEGGSDARYLSTGHIIYARRGTLYARPFDVERLIVGEEVPVIEGVRMSGALTIGTGTAHYAVSETGTFVFVPGPASALSNRRAIVRVKLNGEREHLGLAEDGYGIVRLSPDGQQLAVDTETGDDAMVSIYDMDGTSPLRRLTFEGRSQYPLWSRDSGQIVFYSERNGQRGLFIQPADGKGQAEQLTSADENVLQIPESWSPIAGVFLFSEVRGGTATLWLYSLRDRTATRFGDLEAVTAFNAAFSRDGGWVAYTQRSSTPAGVTANIWVAAFPWTDVKFQITTGNGHHPVWLPDGRLSYRTGATVQEAVQITTRPRFSPSKPVQLVGGDGLPILTLPGSQPYDVTHDGSAFLAVDTSPTEDPRAPEMRIVVNWFEELKRLVRAR